MILPMFFPFVKNMRVLRFRRKSHWTGIRFQSDSVALLRSGKLRQTRTCRVAGLEIVRETLTNISAPCPDCPTTHFGVKITPMKKRHDSKHIVPLRRGMGKTPHGSSMNKRYDYNFIRRAQQHQFSFEPNF
jgi:hypothetical protein